MNVYGWTNELFLVSDGSNSLRISPGEVELSAELAEERLDLYVSLCSIGMHWPALGHGRPLCRARVLKVGLLSH